MEEDYSEQHKHSKLQIFIVLVVFAVGLYVFLERDTVLGGLINLDNDRIVNKVYTVSAADSVAQWRTINSFRGRVVSEGTMQISSGEFEVKKGELVSSVISLDVRSLRVVDTSAERSQAKEKYLKSDLFLGSDKNPSLTFEMQPSEVSSNAIENKDFILEGKLTIKGASNSVSIPASIENTGDDVLRLKSKININNTAFFDILNVQDALVELDSGASDTFEIVLNLIAE